MVSSWSRHQSNSSIVSMASFWYASSVNKQPAHRDTQSEQAVHMEPERCPATPRQHPPAGPARGACCCWEGGTARGGTRLQRSFIMRRCSCGELLGFAAVTRAGRKAAVGPECAPSHTQLYSLCMLEWVWNPPPPSPPPNSPSIWGPLLIYIKSAP